MEPGISVCPLCPMGSISNQKEEDRREGGCNKRKVNPGEG